MMVHYKGQTIDVMPGDVVLFENKFIFTRPITWLAAAIRMFTGVEWNHCAVVTSSWGILMLNEALAPGVITRPLHQHLARTKTKIMILRPISGVTEPHFCRRSIRKLGTKYDFSSLLFFQVIFRLTGCWIGPKGKRAADRMTCFEFAAWCHNQDRWWDYSGNEFMSNQAFVPAFIE